MKSLILNLFFVIGLSIPILTLAKASDSSAPIPYKGEGTYEKPYIVHGYKGILDQKFPAPKQRPGIMGYSPYFTYPKDIRGTMDVQWKSTTASIWCRTKAQIQKYDRNQRYPSPSPFSELRQLDFSVAMGNDDYVYRIEFVSTDVNCGGDYNIAYSLLYTTPTPYSGKGTYYEPYYIQTNWFLKSSYELKDAKRNGDYFIYASPYFFNPDQKHGYIKFDWSTSGCSTSTILYNSKNQAIGEDPDHIFDGIVANEGEVYYLAFYSKVSSCEDGFKVNYKIYTTSN